jgi:NAD(P)-dependent dehydrogenase (short-subunit alcohol dehydrogenase family)
LVEYNRHQAKLKRLLLRRACPPEDVARGVLFLVSPDSAYITGEILHVDGGGAAGMRVSEEAQV